jgi:single-stranded DNA-binding protein
MLATNVTATKMTKDNHTPQLINTLLFFGEKKADIAEKNIKKGSYYHRGQTKIRSYDNKYRKKRYFTEVITK